MPYFINEELFSSRRYFLPLNTCAVHQLHTDKKVPPQKKLVPLEPQNHLVSATPSLPTRRRVIDEVRMEEKNGRQSLCPLPSIIWEVNAFAGTERSLIHPLCLFFNQTHQEQNTSVLGTYLESVLLLWRLAPVLTAYRTTKQYFLKVCLLGSDHVGPQ